MEQEIVGMGLDLFHAPAGAAGNMTSGGTESIVMAVKACRDWSRARRGDAGFRGNIVAATTAHPAFDKAGSLMDLQVRRVPTRADYRADVPAMATAIDADTIMLVGSAPCFPFGVIDPLAELSALALQRGVWLHSDACVGGWMAPFAAEIGRAIPQFDLGLHGRVLAVGGPAQVRVLPEAVVGGVLSFGGVAGAPGDGVRRLAQWTLRDPDAGRHPRGWRSGCILGGAALSRSRRAIAASPARCWTCGTLISTWPARDYRAMCGSRGAPELAVIAFGCDDIDMGAVATLMGERDWVPGVVRDPASLHLMLSLHHAPAREAYVRDVAESVEAVRKDASVGATQAVYS